MVDFVVKTQFRAIDRITPDLKKMGITVVKTGRMMDKSFKRASRSAGVFRGVLKGVIVAGAIRRAAGLASNAVRGLADEFVEFDDNITKAVVRLPGQLDRTSDAFKQLGAVARVEAKRTEFTAGEAALGVEQLALAGFGLEKVAATLPGVLNLATNANVDLARATEIAVKTMGAFGLKGGNAAETTKQLTRVNNVFSKAVSSASIDMEGLFEAIKFGGSEAHTAGVSLEEFVGIAQILANATKDGSVAGTSMRSMFLKLSDITPKARKQFRKMGIGIKDGRLEFDKFADVIGKVEKGTAKMSKQQKLGALKVIFGKTAVGAASIAVRKGAKGLENYTANLSNLTNESEVMAKAIRDSLGNRILRLKSGLVDLGFQFIDTFKKNADAINGAIEAVASYDMKPIIKQTKDLIRFSKDLFNAVKPLWPLIEKTAAFLVIYKVAMKGVIALKAAQTFLALAAAAKAAAGAQGLLNVALLFSPIGIITFAVIGLSAALAILITDFDSVSGGWEAMFVHLEILSLKIGRTLKNVAGDILNTFLTVAFEIPKILTKGTALEGAAKKFFKAPQVPRVDTSDDDAAIKEAENRLRETQEKTAGLDNTVRRGFVNGRLAGTPGMPTLKVPNVGAAVAASSVKVANDILSIFRSGVASAGQAATGSAPTAPNRSQVEAQKVMFEANINVANATPGTTVDTNTSRGAPKIKKRRSGEQ